MTYRFLGDIFLVQVAETIDEYCDRDESDWWEREERHSSLRRMCNCRMNVAGSDGSCRVCREIYYEERYDEWSTAFDVESEFTFYGFCVGCGQLLDFMDGVNHCLDCLGKRDFDELFDEANADSNGNATIYLEILMVTKHSPNRWRIVYRPKPNSTWQELIVTASYPAEAVSKVAAFVFQDSIGLAEREFNGTI